MGNTNTSNVEPDEESCIAEIVKAMMPLYYHEMPVTKAHITLAQTSWNSILTETAPGLSTLERPSYIGLRVNPFRVDAPGHIRFREYFFHRYFDIQPSVEHMFSLESVVSGPFIGSMVHKCLSQLDQPKQFRSGMVKLATDHIRRGVWAIQYGTVGEVLFWSLRKCLGKSYTREVEIAWKVIFSSVLRVMVPVAVFYEKNNSSPQLLAEHTKQSTRPSVLEDEDTMTLAALVMVQRGDMISSTIV
jgi:hemoglobin-like flavoprotein